MFRRFTFLLLLTFLLALVLASAQTAMPGRVPSHISTPTHTVASVIETPTPSAAKSWHSLILRHASPSNILKWINWDILANGTRNPNLPDGIARIFALPSNNSLLMEATDSGYANFMRSVTALDIAPKRAQLHVLLAAVARSLDLAIVLTDPRGALATLQKTSSAVLQSQSSTMDSFTLVDLPINMTLPRPGAALYPWARLVGQNWNTLAAIPTFRIEPQVNSDSTITLMTTAGADGTATTVHNIASGGLWVYEVTRQAQTAGYRVFLFLTPTLLPEKSHTGDEEYQAVTVTP